MGLEKGGKERRGGRRNRRRGQARPARWQPVGSSRGRGNVVGGSTTDRNGSPHRCSADVLPDLFQLTLPPPRVLVREVQRRPRRQSRAEQVRRAGLAARSKGVKLRDRREAPFRDRAGTRGPRTCGVLRVLNGSGRRGTARRLRNPGALVLPHGEWGQGVGELDNKTLGRKGSAAPHECPHSSWTSICCVPRCRPSVPSQKVRRSHPPPLGSAGARSPLLL